MSLTLEDQSGIQQTVDHLYRHEYGKLVSVMTKTFGTSNIELAEDTVQDAMYEAVKQWAYKGVPDNPVGWIYRVAKYKAINQINREKLKSEYTNEVARHVQSEKESEPIYNQIFTDKEIADDQLRMMFTCCHPVVSSDSQIALTLKTLCGFSVLEIANAFLTTEENIRKRLVRARKNIRDAKVEFEVPTGKELDLRHENVLETIYLLFNEGYNSTGGTDAIKYELCEEAIRLTEIIISNQNMTKTANAYALLALMSLNVSRFDSRIDEHFNVVTLENQDRSKWNKQLIEKGIRYLEYATRQNEISVYHILATISAHYCTAGDFESTDWVGILELYDHLIQLDASPIAYLNRAIVISQISGASDGLAAIDNISDKVTLHAYLPYYTTKAELHIQNKEPEMAQKLLSEALKLPINDSVKSLIESRVLDYSKKR